MEAGSGRKWRPGAGGGAWRALSRAPWPEVNAAGLHWRHERPETGFAGNGDLPGHRAGRRGGAHAAGAGVDGEMARAALRERFEGGPCLARLETEGLRVVRRSLRAELRRDPGDAGGGCEVRHPLRDALVAAGQYVHRVVHEGADRACPPKAGGEIRDVPRGGGLHGKRAAGGVHARGLPAGLGARWEGLEPRARLAAARTGTAALLLEE